jgi:hypothetical protein
VGQRLLSAAVLDDPASIADEPEGYAKISVTSMHSWAAYIRKLEALGLPPLAFVTELSVIPDAKNQFALVFKAKEKIDDGEAIGALLARADELDKTIGFPYQLITESQQPAARQGGRAAPATAAAQAGLRQGLAAKKAPVKTAAEAPAAEAPAAEAPAAGTRRRKF